jgi:hypothetical protein
MRSWPPLALCVPLHQTGGAIEFNLLAASARQAPNQHVLDEGVGHVPQIVVCHCPRGGCVVRHGGPLLGDFNYGEPDE